MDNFIYPLDQICDDFFYTCPANSTNINDSVYLWRDNLFGEKMDDFPDLRAKKGGIRLANPLINLFLHQHINHFYFPEKLRLI